MGSPLYITGLLVGLLGQLAPVDVVARVDGDTIAATDLQERAALTRAAGGTPRADLLTEDLINEALMAREARSRGLARQVDVVAAVEAARRRLAAKLLEQELASSIKVDESQLTELFHKTSDSVSLEGVILGSEADAKAALDRLQKGAKLADEAKSSFDTESAKNGGKLGTRSRGQLDPALADTLFRAPLNTFVGPVKLELGWAVVRVLSRQVGDAAELAKRRDDLRKFAESQKRAQARTHYIMQLRKQANVKVDEAFIRTTGTRLDPSPADAAHPVANAGNRPVLYSEVVAEVKRLFGGAQGGHASGPAVKLEMAWSIVDRTLFENAALARGYGDAPEVRAKLPSAERDVLARRFSNDLRAAAPGPGGDESVRKMITTLRSRAHIEVDKDALARASQAPR